MLLSYRASIIGFLCLGLSSFAQSQFGNYQEIFENDRGLCTFDFDNPSGYFAYNGIAARYGNVEGVGSGDADHTFLVICKFNLIGQDVRTTQTITYKNPNIVPTVVVPFTDIPVTSLVKNSNAECTAVAGSTYNGFFQIQETYALNSAPIVPITTTTTVVVPTSALTTSTTTTTLVQQTETTVTPDTVTRTVATGTKIVLGKPTLTTKTITITPWARTVKQVAITYTTTTLICVPPKNGGRRRANRQDRALAAHEIFARQASSDIETATCFGQQVTPTVVNTAFATSTTTTETLIEQALATSTNVNTVVAPAPTAIQNVKATTTVTPVFTRYRWTVLPRVTVTKSIAITNTVTKVPKTPLTSCVKPTPVPQPGGQCKNPTTMVKDGCRKVSCN